LPKKKEKRMAKMASLDAENTTPTDAPVEAAPVDVIPAVDTPVVDHTLEGRYDQNDGSFTVA